MARRASSARSSRSCCGAGRSMANSAVETGWRQPRFAPSLAEVYRTVPVQRGARFGYTLLSVILLSNLMAILLQGLAAKLGIVSGRDLAQACRDHYSRPV